MPELFGMVVFIGFPKKTADMLLVNQNESIDGGKGSINHVNGGIYGGIFMRLVSQTNFWRHLWQQIAICQSNAQYFGGNYTFVNQIQKQHLWWQNVVMTAGKY